ncbi:hypothetical protein GWK47_006211 [Chionoecetes opilio]|uniref:Uncharacterized protein n=1 Tax=Chionoecetes opilio TaxID=41210 RepID=A0A8J5CU08_CHIOP|nr:hypothetical protein GWK47_006211 [Chionoecetes opilio]
MRPTRGAPEPADEALPSKREALQGGQAFFSTAKVYHGCGATNPVTSPGATWDAAATLQEAADGQPRGIVLARREPSRRGVLVWIPHWPPPDPVLGAPARRDGIRCSYKAGPFKPPPDPVFTLTCGGTPRPLDLAASDFRVFAGSSRNPSAATAARRFGHSTPVSAAQELGIVCGGVHVSRRLLRRPTGGWMSGGRGSWLPQLAVPGIRAWNRRCPLPRSGKIPRVQRGPRQLRGRRLLPLASTSVRPQPPPLQRIEDTAEPDGPAAGGGRRGLSVTFVCPCGGIWSGRPAPVMTRDPAPLAMAPMAGLHLLWPPP